MSYNCLKLQAALNEFLDAKPTNYLTDYPYLTLLGRTAGLSDDKIAEINEKIVNNKELLSRIYDIET